MNETPCDRVDELLKSFPIRTARPNSESRTICCYLESHGVQVDDQVRHGVHEFVLRLQARRSARRRPLECRAVERLRTAPLDELKERQTKARTRFARKVLKKAFFEKRFERENELLMSWQAKRSATETSRVYHGSDAAATRRLHRKLENLGHEGRVAAELLRAQKASARAKRYGSARPGPGATSYREHAYGRKSDCIARICALLTENNCELGWGWGHDADCRQAEWVLYVDLPNGQVSFHSEHRHQGPDYPGKWDAMHASEERVIGYCDSLLSRVDAIPAATVTTRDARSKK